MKDFVFVMNNQTIEEIERRILLNKEKFLFLNKYMLWPALCLLGSSSVTGSARLVQNNRMIGCPPDAGKHTYRRSDWLWSSQVLSHLLGWFCATTFFFFFYICIIKYNIDFRRNFFLRFLTSQKRSLIFDVIPWKEIQSSFRGGGGGENRDWWGFTNPPG